MQAALVGFLQGQAYRNHSGRSWGVGLHALQVYEVVCTANIRE